MPQILLYHVINTLNINLDEKSTSEIIDLNSENSSNNYHEKQTGSKVTNLGLSEPILAKSTEAFINNPTNTEPELLPLVVCPQNTLCLPTTSNRINI